MLLIGFVQVERRAAHPLRVILDRYGAGVFLGNLPIEAGMFG
jgi:hypothetical protein